MSPEQRGYLHGEVFPAFAYGIDRLLDAIGQPIALWSNARMKAMLKWAFRIESTEALTDAETADFISEVQAFAAENLIFIATPEEWERGIAERERDAHYAYVLEPEYEMREAA